MLLTLKLRCTGLDPRILAALAAARRVNAPLGQPQGRNAAAYRRSVDMGMLAHAAAMGGAGRHGGNSAGFTKQFGEQTSRPEGSPVSFTVTHLTGLCVYVLQPGELSLRLPYDAHEVADMFLVTCFLFCAKADRSSEHQLWQESFLPLCKVLLSHLV